MTKENVSDYFKVYTKQGEHGLCNVVKFTTKHIDEDVFPEIKKDIIDYFNSSKGRRLGGKYHCLNMKNVKHADNYCLTTIAVFNRLNQNHCYGALKVTHCRDDVEKLVKVAGLDKIMQIGYEN
jgi:hypothetical protein